MQATAEEQRKNQEAESSKVRKQLWDWEEPVQNDEEMRTTILGDVTHPAPIIMQSPAPTPQSQLAPLLAGFGIAAASGLGGYFLAGKDAATQVQPPAPIQYNDETVSVGLGRIEDYLQGNASK